MDIENLKVKIAEIAGASSAEADLAFKLCIDKISELLDYDEALKIPGLGIFNLKREPLTRQERQENQDETNQSKQTLIFSPENDPNEPDSSSMYLTIDLNEQSGNPTDFDENIFSLGVDKPLVPVSSTQVDIDESNIAQNLDNKISVLVSTSEKIPEFNMWEDFEVQSPTETGAKEEDPFSQIDDDLKDIMSQTTMSEETKEPEVEKEEETEPETDLAAELDLSDLEDDEEENRSFENLQTELENDPESSTLDEDNKSDFGIEDITFSDDLDLDDLGLNDDEEAKPDSPVSEESSAAEEDKSDSTTEDGTSTDEEINWDWGDELSLDDPETEKVEDLETEVSEKSEELDPELFDKIEEDTESSIEDSIDIGDELDLNFDEEKPEEAIKDEDTEDKEGDSDGEEESAEESTDSEEIDLEIEDSDEELVEEASSSRNTTIEYTPGEEQEGSAEKKSKKSIVGLPLYLGIGAVSIIIVFGIYYLFFAGSTPVESVPAKSEQINEDTIKTQLSTKLEPQDNPIVKESNSEDKSDDNSDDIIKSYSTAPNKIAEKHNVKTEPEALKISSSKLYRKVENEKRVSNLVFFDGSKYNVQVSSWKTNKQAEAQARKLISKGHKAFIVEAYLSALGGTWYRVRIGDFDSAKEAENYRKNNKL